MSRATHADGGACSDCSLSCGVMSTLWKGVWAILSQDDAVVKLEALQARIKIVKDLFRDKEVGGSGNHVH